MRRERIRALDAQLNDVDRKLPRKASDLLRWLGRDELARLLDIRKRQVAGATLTPVETAEMIGMFRRAVERKEAGLAPDDPYPERAMETRQWHTWARKHNVPFRTTESGESVPVRMMPDPDD